MSEMDPRASEVPSPEELARRLTWFREDARSTNGQLLLRPLRCPCCGCLTLDERGMYEICPVCYWEDDGQDDHDADRVRGGPNELLSLTQARKNYLQVGACDLSMVAHVRPPLPAELPMTKGQ